MTSPPSKCKRLAEVDFPISIVSREAAIEKAGPKGHPSMLHLWWARRPLASERSILMSLLLPDPCDPACPEKFKKESRKALESLLIDIDPTDESLRDGLMQFIARFSDWTHGNDKIYIKCARDLVLAAYDGETPLVVDPFAGGGSIPYEALRVGCDTFASDLNPVSGLILKVLLEDISHDGSALAKELRKIGIKVLNKTKVDLERLYPSDPDGKTPIAYLWARTVRCEAPNCGADIPLIRSFWLSRRGSRQVALQPIIQKTPGNIPSVSFEVFSPSSENDVKEGTVSRANAKCLACGSNLPSQRVRKQLRSQRGGASTNLDKHGHRIGGATLLAVVTVDKTKSGKQFRNPSDRDYETIAMSNEYLEKLSKTNSKDGETLIPDEPTPKGGGRGAGRAFALHQYGILQWADLFTDRQKVAILTLQKNAKELSQTTLYPDIIPELLAVAVDRVIMSNVSLTNWNSFSEKMQHGFGMQVLRIVWDFAEVVPLADAPGNWKSGYELVANVAEKTPVSSTMSRVYVADATEHPLPDDSAFIWFTDPPYYDAVPYSDLSDFFYVWLRRMLPNHPLLIDPFDSDNKLTPKTKEIVQDETRFSDDHPKDKSFFEFSMSKAFAEGKRIIREDGIGCVVFAHKTTEGWEALLSGIVKNGWVVTASWPLVTEMGTRLRARESAALATSIHLICRPRAPGSPIGDWSEVVKELFPKVRDWVEKLTKEGVRGADLVFACIGPAMEVYSKYSKVVNAQDIEIPLGGDPSATNLNQQGFLSKVWEVVARVALEQILREPEGSITAIEEDSRLTALFLWALQNSDYRGLEEINDEEGNKESDETKGTSTNGYNLAYDIVRRVAQPLGIHLETWEGRIIETKKGIVRLLSISERLSQLFEEEEVDRLPLNSSITSDRVNRQVTLYPESEDFLLVSRNKTLKDRSVRILNNFSNKEMKYKASTTLDRLHIAMLLQANGASQQLRNLLQSEKKRGTEFEKLARSLTALYPKDSEERRLIEALSLVIPN